MTYHHSSCGGKDFAHWVIQLRRGSTRTTRRVPCSDQHLPCGKQTCIVERTTNLAGRAQGARARERPRRPRHLRAVELRGSESTTAITSPSRYDLSSR